jgi:SAM-dependent methyltransferase
MCNQACIAFGTRHLGPDDIAGKRVIEVGSRIVQDLDTTLRHHLASLRPELLLGVDAEPGRGVDRIVDAGDLVAAFGPASFDAVVCTEVVEHVRDWRRAFDNLKGVLRPGGVLLLTTRSPGFPYHGWPRDYWRFTAADLRAILADMQIEALAEDPSAPGVLVKARKPEAFVAKDLSAMRLPSAVGGARRRRPPPLVRIALHRLALRTRGWLRYRGWLGPPP